MATAGLRREPPLRHTSRNFAHDNNKHTLFYHAQPFPSEETEARYSQRVAQPWDLPRVSPILQTARVDGRKR